MSGGSFDYLYCKDPSDLFNCSAIQSIDEMATILISHGDIDVAKDMLRLKETIEQALVRVEVKQEKLQDVMESIEWWQSSDYGEDTFNEHLNQYRKDTQK